MAAPNLRRPPIHHMKKEILVWMATHTCAAHRHSYLEHYQCWVREQAEKPERIGFLDIEASNLKPDFGIVLSYCIKDSLSDKIYGAVLTKQDIDRAKAGDEDRRVVQSAIEHIGMFDKIVTFYGKRFDVPFLRSRAAMTKQEFPVYGTLKHVDCYDIVKRNYNLSSRRLENCCRQLLGDTQKTRIEMKYWRGGVRGDKKSLAYIDEHCRYDVLDLERLYNFVVPFSRKQDQSI